MTSLTEHFTLEELTHSDIAVRKGLDNTPDAETIANLTILAQTLERVRTLLNAPIHINSGYRSQKVNAAVGSAPTSKHCLGLAADFTCPQFGTPQDVAKAIIKAAIGFDQLIYEGTWVHLGLAEPDASWRNQVLTAHFGNGKTIYTEGIA